MPRFADIILPLPLKGRFTYSLPGSMEDQATTGARVIVQFGSRKLYSGVIAEVHDKAPEGQVKEVSELLDHTPVINPDNLRLWNWISSYYLCPEGDVLKAAVPSGLCLESETLVSPADEFTDFTHLDGPAYALFSLISNKQKIRLKSLPPKIDDKNTIKILNELVNAGAVITGENITPAYKTRKESHVILSRKYTDAELNRIIDSLKKAARQSDLLLAYLGMTGYVPGADLYPVKKSLLLREGKGSLASLSGLVRKGILVIVDLEVSRLSRGMDNVVPLKELSEAQHEAMEKVKKGFSSKNIVLLKGVTSSGKTELYTHLIAETIKEGRQALYLLPEIALTTQIIERLRKHFGNSMGVYHSRLSDSERVEIWKKVSGKDPGNTYKLIIGVRSSVFLPFTDLGLVIIDEEHDGSYKQHDPSPRYNARDTAIILAGYSSANILLGSATPSIESYHNAMTGKYFLVELKERFGKVNLPDIVLANTREAYRRKMMVSHFTPELLSAIDGALGRKEQVMLFRNRRGFSPYIECTECGWVPSCSDCSVKLTYHRKINRLVCHYCGVSIQVVSKCGNCGSMSMVTRGFGTEKLEDEIKIVFPDATVSRMDQDTTRTKNSFNKIISDFETGRTDILIGTQMVSKGLDFENLTVVGILNADSMLNFPDFRAHERAFQMMSQVSGRAGRRQKHGKVIIQTSDTTNRIIRYVVNNDYEGLYRSQKEERELFAYPPFSRLIKITVKSKDIAVLNLYADALGNDLRTKFGSRILGPEYPLVSRIQGWHLKSLIVKIERNRPLARAKELVSEALVNVAKGKGTSGIRVSIDVDPY
ncbi:MAG: primosomal protein N' [Bacteroidales bacterium]